MKRAVLVLLAACADEPRGGGPNVNSTVDTFFVAPRYPPVVDMLVVLDHTTAMAPYQSGLAAFATSFVTFANSELVHDIRLAVTTTDATGALRDPAMSSDAFVALSYDVHFERQPNFTGSLTDAVTQLLTVGASSSATVRPLDAAAAALDANATFVRENSDLGIVTIAAIDDASSGAIADYASGLKARKADPVRVHVAGVYPTSATRLTSFHAQFPNRTASADIATTDFMDVLGTIPDTLRTVLGFRCYQEPLDLDPNTVGPQYDCDLHATFEDGTEVAVRHCPTVTSGPCFEFVPEPQGCMGDETMRVQIRGFPTPYYPSIEGQCVVSAEN